MAKVALKYIGPSAVIGVPGALDDEGKPLSVERGGKVVIDESIADGLLAQGCSFIPKSDKDGNPVLDKDGEPVIERVEVDPQWEKTKAPTSSGGKE